MKRLLAFGPFLLLFLLALVVGTVFRYPLVLDDPFITYRYASNLIAGNGFVFNTGERILSTTAPLYALVLAVPGLVYADIPALGFWLSVIALGAAAALIYALASLGGMRLGGLIGGVLLVLSPALVITLGLETAFYLMLGLGAFYAYLRQRVTLAFALAALLTLTRNDGLLLAAILGAHYVYAQRASFAHRSALRDARLVRPFLIYLLLLAPWLLFSFLYFGSPFPFTLSAKVAQAQSGLWSSFGIGFAGWGRDNILWLGPLTLAAAVGIVWAVRQKSLLLLVGVWAVLHLLAYTILGVAFYAWYVAPLIPALMLFAGIGIQVSARWLARQFGQKEIAVWGIASVLAVVLVLAELRVDFNLGMTNPSPKAVAYAQAADWLAQHTAPDATVDALEVGIIGFFDARPTYDFVGLVDPMRVPYLREQKFIEGVKRRAADYVIAIPPDVWLTQDSWFNNTYRSAQEIHVPGFYNNRPLVIYERATAGQTPIETRVVNADFEKRIELANVELFTKQIRRGEILPLRLNLRALDNEPVPDSWKLTVQLVGKDNQIVAQADPFYPVRLPEDGKPFTYEQGLTIPADAPAGEYDLVLAMYDVANRERLSLYGADGNETGDFVPLGKVLIKE